MISITASRIESSDSWRRGRPGLRGCDEPDAAISPRLEILTISITQPALRYRQFSINLPRVKRQHISARHRPGDRRMAGTRTEIPATHRDILSTRGLSFISTIRPDGLISTHPVSLLWD